MNRYDWLFAKIFVSLRYKRDKKIRKYLEKVIEDKRYIILILSFCNIIGINLKEVKNIDWNDEEIKILVLEKVTNYRRVYIQDITHATNGLLEDAAVAKMFLNEKFNLGLVGKDAEINTEDLFNRCVRSEFLIPGISETY